LAHAVLLYVRAFADGGLVLTVRERTDIQQHCMSQMVAKTSNPGRP
jgi:hypothetical protein